MPSLARERVPVRWLWGFARKALCQGPCRNRGERPFQSGSSAKAGVGRDLGPDPRSRAWRGRPVSKARARRASTPRSACGEAPWHPWLLPPSGGLLVLVRAGKGIEGVIRRELPGHVLEGVFYSFLAP